MPSIPREDPDYRHFYETIRRVRLSKRMSQESLGVAVGFSTPTICDIEKGKRRVDVVEFFRIARAMGVSPSEMYQSAVDGVVSNAFEMTD